MMKTRPVIRTVAKSNIWPIPQLIACKSSSVAILSKRAAALKKRLNAPLVERRWVELHWHSNSSCGTMNPSLRHYCLIQLSNTYKAKTKKFVQVQAQATKLKSFITAILQEKLFKQPLLLKSQSLMTQNRTWPGYLKTNSNGAISSLRKSIRRWKRNIQRKKPCWSKQ